MWEMKLPLLECHRIGVISHFCLTSLGRFCHLIIKRLLMHQYVQIIRYLRYINENENIMVWTTQLNFNEQVLNKLASLGLEYAELLGPL